MRRASAWLLALLFLATPAKAADWTTVHDKAIERHHLEQNWGKEAGAQSPGSFFYQEYRAEVLEDVRHDWAVQQVVVVADSVDQAPPAAPAATVTHDVGSIPEIICSYDWDCGIALGVSSCESGQSPTAGTPGNYYGLFQVDYETSSDPVIQVRHAYEKYVSAGRTWRPWGWPDGAFGCYW